MMRVGVIAVLSFVVALATAGPFPSRAKAQDDDSAPNPYGKNSAKPPDEQLSMRVNLHTQRAYLYRGGEEIDSVPISSGRRHYRTPTGTFTVLEKQKIYHSKKYQHAPMPYMQRLTWSGVALHAGSVPRHPSSHGCIHLPRRFASWLFDQPTMGMKVVVTDEVGPEKRLGDSASRVAAADMDEGDTDTSE